MLFEKEIKDYVAMQLEDVKKKENLTKCEKCQSVEEKIKERYEKYSENQYINEQGDSIEKEHLVYNGSDDGIPSVTNFKCNTCLNELVEVIDPSQGVIYKLKEEADYKETVRMKLENIKHTIEHYLMDQLQNREERVAVYFRAASNFREDYNENLRGLYTEEEYEEKKHFKMVKIYEQEAFEVNTRFEDREQFLIKAMYPIKDLKIEYVEYYGSFSFEADVRLIEDVLFYDVYDETFKKLEEFDKDIHWLERGEQEEKVLVTKMLEQGYEEEHEFKIFDEMLRKELKKMRHEIIGVENNGNRESDLGAFFETMNRLEKERKTERRLERLEQLKNRKPKKTIEIKKGVFNGLKGYPISETESTYELVLYGEKNKENKLVIPKQDC